MKDVIKDIIIIFISSTIGFFYGWYDHEEYSNKPLVINESITKVDNKSGD